MQVAIRELKSNLSHYLSKVRSGEIIEITSHRRPVAQITGIENNAGIGLQKLLHPGYGSWSGKKPDWKAPVVLTESMDQQGQASTKPLSQLILDDRS